MLDVANAANVSRSTASLVLRGSPLVAEPTRARVMEAMSTLGYVYHRGAAMLREGRTRTIGLLVNDIANPYVAEFVAFLDQALERGGQVALLANSAESDTRQQQVLLRLREHSVDGVVFSPAEDSDERVIDELEFWQTPFVQALRYVSQTRGDYAGADYAEALRLAVRHLVALGHRKIAYIGGGPKPHSASREREQGFADEMHRQGLTAHRQHVGGVTGLDGAAAISDMMAQPDPPTAVICYNDPVAQGVLGRLQAHGLLPGRDVAVVGVDDLPSSAASWPSLTTVATAMNEVGAAVVALLARRIADPHAPVRRVVIAPRLIVRQSCGARE
ncbi:transcriptional regulator [Ameyamaea chiangmaiensis NBRC 103196]|nr:transcriptional regulator [Ameyamaea chiangmaiensis NBRC 103196]